MNKYVNVILCILIGALLWKTVNIPIYTIDGGTPWSNQYADLPTHDITNMYSGYVDEWKIQIKTAFDEAESQVFKVEPKPDIVIPSQDPDPKKCICKGSGIIIHGDGHKTYCQYHGPKQSRMESGIKGKELIIVRPLNILEK